MVVSVEIGLWMMLMLRQVGLLVIDLSITRRPLKYGTDGLFRNSMTNY